MELQFIFDKLAKKHFAGSIPIFFNNNGCWYFWDETWMEKYGPYDLQSDAKDALAAYLKWL